MNEKYCNNCGKVGHLYHQCKMPITSIGIVVFRIVNKEVQYLLIQRKDTFGYIDFMRGKYSVHNPEYIKSMFIQMTINERIKLLNSSFDDLWVELWGGAIQFGSYKVEENSSRDKFNTLRRGLYQLDKYYNMESIINESNNIICWKDAEWGFPKGRRNQHESDYRCAMREFCEETGLEPSMFHNIRNIYPYEETFTGSNYKSYKHKYYLAYMDNDNSKYTNNYDTTEVKDMRWFSYDECINTIRPYNLEKLRMLTKIHRTVHCLPLIQF